MTACDVDMPALVLVVLALGMALGYLWRKS